MDQEEEFDHDNQGSAKCAKMVKDKNHNSETKLSAQSQSRSCIERI